MKAVHFIADDSVDLDTIVGAYLHAPGSRVRSLAPTVATRNTFSETAIACREELETRYVIAWFVGNVIQEWQRP